MDHQLRPYRSVLYIPASKQRALEKARGLATDAIIFDLEDAVAPAEKDAARGLLGQMLADTDYGTRLRIVRINALDTDWGPKDVAALTTSGATDAVLLPKVNGVADIEALATMLPQMPIWAMMETAQGILNAGDIAAHPRLGGMVMGTNDLAKELNCRPRPDRMPLLTALQTCLLAARSQGVIVVDGVYNAYKDAEGLRRECLQGRDMGFDGKTLIHPAQLQVANKIFAPDEQEVDLAKRQIAAHEAAEKAGQGVAVLDGRIVENLHVETARRTLERAAAIRALEESL